METEILQEQSIWYFAYGANMSPDVLVKQRKVNPQKQVIVGLPDYALEFNVPGVPYSEPAMAGLIRLIHMDKKSTDNVDIVPVYGVAYFISREDFTKIIATEGAGVAYTILQATAKVVAGVDGEIVGDSLLGKELPVFTLVARRPARTIRRPSTRYLELLNNAAKSQNLPLEYQRWLSRKKAFQPPEGTPPYEAGKRYFNFVWFRVQRQIQKGIIKYRNADGLVPFWFLWVFDVLLVLMWMHHDYFHRFLWGRGDGK